MTRIVFRTLSNGAKPAGAKRGRKSSAVKASTRKAAPAGTPAKQLVRYADMTQPPGAGSTRKVDAASPTFGRDLQKAFAVNVREARRENKRVAGRFDLAPRKP